MSQRKELDDIFDDDFEVTYEEESDNDEDDFENDGFYETEDFNEKDSEDRKSVV